MYFKIIDSSFRLLSQVIVILTIIMLVSCATVRKVTYPPDFIYLESTQIRTSMLRMSLAMRRIDEVLAGQLPVDSTGQQRIVESLDIIDEITEQLDTGNSLTNHLLMDENLDHFRIEVRNAIRMVNAELPQYYAASRLSAHCVGCHRFR